MDEKQRFSLTLGLRLDTERAGVSAFERIKNLADTERELSVHLWPPEEGASVRFIHVSFHRVAAFSLPEAEHRATDWIHSALYGITEPESVTPFGLIVWED